MEIFVGILFLIVVILYIVAGYTPIDTGTIGAVFRFKKFRRILRPGFNVIIPLIDTVEIYPIQVHQIELPDEPNNVDRLHDMPDTGKVLPFRINHKGMLEAIFYQESRFGHVDQDRPETEYDRVHFQNLPPEKQEAIKKDSLNAPLTSEIAVVVKWHLVGVDRRIVETFI